MPPLTLLPAASGDVREAYDEWSEEGWPGLGEEFLAEVRRTLALVEMAPRLYPRIHKDIRRALLRRFPYSILYVGEPDATLVLACFHGSRNPRYWYRPAWR